MKTIAVLFLLAAAPIATPLLAAPTSSHALRRWDAVSHRAMAALAYDRLRPATRARVDALLRAHPDLAQLGQGVDVASATGVRELFMRASVWPDRIRNDARFYRETVRNVEPTPLLPGFPTMARRDGWHYLLRAFSTDGTPAIALEAPHAASVMPRLADELADASAPASVRAYNLSWIIHIVGDLHQPLHGTSRATRERPNGDAGGNAVFVRLWPDRPDSANLHGVWDGWVGRAERGVRVDEIARTLGEDLPDAGVAHELRIPEGEALAATVLGWADESATLAQYVVYAWPETEGAGPPLLSAEYQAQGEAIARQRLALAAYRLAALLEARLGR
jgi:hypothetical protein